ncbi:PAS domain S-box protein [Natronoflexus pectinivorans]|uniref:PAS domain S-box-containing protein n=1 Tax=Natronoflexus pectinivorans TaxID=682526 RepID=A0A4R2GPE7_9BACT|nr:PAS domain S-box protein [Natronoflexus pectinivorans]TCO10947.1 PAS domain S-box-containing protein [Natronoflexus pectinivorans]
MKELKHISIIKNWKNHFSLSVISTRERYYLLFAILLLLFFSWTGFLAFINKPVSFLNIIKLHKYVPVWIVDLFILSVPLIYLNAKNYISRKNKHIQEEISTLKIQLEKNLKLANALEKNQWDQIVSHDDILSEKLINIGKNIRTSRKKEEEHNWITTGKEQISDILRNSHNLDELSISTIKTIITYMGGIQGAFYILRDNRLKRSAMYAYGRQRFEYNEIQIGKGLIGAAAYEKAMIYRNEIPDDYYTVTSGLLGEQKPRSIVIVPLLQEEELQGVFEIAFLSDNIPGYKLQFATEVSTIIGQTIYNLKITTRTEELLKESQQMTSTLRENEEQLKKNALEMIAAQEELERSNKLLETQIQEVANSRKRLEALLTNASEFISIYDENQELVFESPSVKRILGYKDDDKITGMDPDILTPRGLKTINSLFQYLLDTPGGEQTAQYTYLRKNGEKIFLETKGKNLLHDPAIKGIIFNTQDITERKRAEKEERMKSRMQSLSENSPDMIIRINLMGKLVYVNPAVTNFVDLPAGELIKKRISEVEIDTRFIDYVEECLVNIRDNQEQTISEVSIQSPSGERIMEIKAIPELGEEGELETILFVAHDMTEFKKIEQDIKEKNKKISDSINYAQRIQTSILPDTRLIQEYFPRSFIFYRPKDVVSGDFPWFFQKNDISYVAAVDCTGHGVPGALISFIGYFLLNNIVNAQDNATAAEILDELHYKVRSTLKQDQEGATGRDGMDLALCIIDQKNQTINFAGAHRPLFLVRNGELSEYQGTRKAIGGIPLRKKVEKDFENHVINYEKGDQIFFFSDGLPDQFGGPDTKKYQPKRIREALTASPNQSMAYFARYFSKDFYDWMGDEKQLDDVLLIGIEL